MMHTFLGEERKFFYVKLQTKVFILTENKKQPGSKRKV